MAQSKHIDKVLDRHSDETIANNRLRLKTSINVIRWLAFQACSFRGDDESPGSLNRENFIELIKLLASCNQNVNNVLENAPGNAQYISPGVQKDILHIFARKVRAIIREEIGDSKFCIIIDEARDESKREQMSVVLRFVDKHGCVQERFFDLIHVSDTCSLTLKTEISSVLSRHNLDVQNLRGQGYDGASNMRGEWNGLQALFLKDCPFAYYIHCLAHRLQLALVSAAKEVCYVHQFFSKLTLIVNVVTVSPKRHDQLRVAQANNVANLIANDQIVTGSGLNQIGTLQRARDTRWGSHLNSVRNLLCMFDATCEVLEKTTEEGNFSTRGDASAAYDAITSFEFVFVLHLMRNILEVSHDLCQALQRKNQDILNALTLVSTTKTLIQRMRESSWEAFIKEVILFCEKHEVEVPDMNALHIPRRGRTRKIVDQISVEHHYRVNLFLAVIDTQLQELNGRFNDNMVELLTLSSTLDPRDNYKFFSVNKVCELVERFYPGYFNDQEKFYIRMQAQHYELDVPNHAELTNLCTISELCQGLTKTGKSLTYPLIDRLIRLDSVIPKHKPCSFFYERCRHNQEPNPSRQRYYLIFSLAHVLSPEVAPRDVEVHTGERPEAHSQRVAPSGGTASSPPAQPACGLFDVFIVQDKGVNSVSPLIRPSPCGSS
ncbi:zinc finger MYM-type protein 1-like [Arachis ipaensis]|uniref:zinc finger MYM-type protein 1-like n=1 Tax=Arachis ipaensis TaxID=130454 RepID=UPI0007AFC30B|nr:zinc finger MYM-type protein 1-like [Arachis ipaensis]